MAVSSLGKEERIFVRAFLEWASANAARFVDLGFEVEHIEIDHTPAHAILARSQNSRFDIAVHETGSADTNYHNRISNAAVTSAVQLSSEDELVVQLDEWLGKVKASEQSQTAEDHKRIWGTEYVTILEHHVPTLEEGRANPFLIECAAWLERNQDGFKNLDMPITHRWSENCIYAKGKSGVAGVRLAVYGNGHGRLEYESYNAKTLALEEIECSTPAELVGALDQMYIQIVQAQQESTAEKQRRIWRIVVDLS